ncbi:hypothetical protein [Mycobacterium hubeiense]|uniref:hypothetical protein n=1 Tax=Mycobacterium hubeiense TaxID=1867256 RepID=UPI001157DA22|nr:hypothetical protein [Mycobacterium sp. QGD 101]
MLLAFFAWAPPMWTYTLMAVLLVLFALWEPNRAGRLRDGWMPTGSMSRKEVLARFRQSYTSTGWACVAVGVGNLVFGIAKFLDGETGVARSLFIGVFFAALGVVAFECRRILDSPPSSPATSAGSE